MSYDLLSRTRIGKTRKDHRCVCCCGIIPTGSINVYSEASVFEGDFQSFYLCGDCERDSETIVAEDDTGDWNTYEWSEMYEAILDMRRKL